MDDITVHFFCTVRLSSFFQNKTLAQALPVFMLHFILPSTIYFPKHEWYGLNLLLYDQSFYVTVQLRMFNC